MREKKMDMQHPDKMLQNPSWNNVHPHGSNLLLSTSVRECNNLFLFPGGQSLASVVHRPETLDIAVVYAALQRAIENSHVKLVEDKLLNCERTHHHQYNARREESESARPNSIGFVEVMLPTAEELLSDDLFNDSNVPEEQVEISAESRLFNCEKKNCFNALNQSIMVDESDCKVVANLNSAFTVCAKNDAAHEHLQSKGQRSKQEIRSRCIEPSQRQGLETSYHPSQHLALNSSVLKSAHQEESTQDKGLTTVRTALQVPSLSIDRLKQLMAESKKSQRDLQAWDEEQGLPRSHSWTMMHTSRSRRQLEENRILPKWNGNPLIDETGITFDTRKKKRRRLNSSTITKKKQQSKKQQSKIKNKGSSQFCYISNSAQSPLPTRVNAGGVAKAA